MNIKRNLLDSIETNILIFGNPDIIADKIIDQKLGHRLSLFIFFWDVKIMPSSFEIGMADLRVVIVTHPRNNV